MRRTRKKAVRDLFESIRKAHKIIKKMSNAAEPQNKEVFVLCQKCAMQIGSEIEYWEGNETVSVRRLEEYCEEVYRCVQNSPLSGRQVCEILEKSITRAFECFEEEIPDDKLEVVFFPYNASMWDSLASIWKAASEDEDCDAYVVPIPYFEKNPDGSFGNMHYEGDLFPMDVPITDWNEYDHTKRFPDLIFIHNPYDEHNFVTSIHPAYYSRILKEYTGLLVYVPYFLFVNDAVGVSTLLTSAVLYADYVIVQSKESCKKCIQFYDQYLEENGCGNLLKPGKEKFLPLGSPIFDALRKPFKTDQIPEEWRQIIQQKGSSPKIVMYNTHISDVMGPNAEKFFLKIRSVLKKFEFQTNIVLLWRPHPLTWQTIRSMNPSAAEEYEKIVNDYCDKRWGIYDDTPDVNRSIAISDAYYGDWSSLVTMFREAGKPVLIQNLDLADEKEFNDTL